MKLTQPKQPHKPWVKRFDAIVLYEDEISAQRYEDEFLGLLWAAKSVNMFLAAMTGTEIN